MGGYLLYDHPEISISLDGHADSFGEELVIEFMTVRQGYAGWEEIQDRYGVDWTLTRRAAPVNQLLEISPEWELVERDDVSALALYLAISAASQSAAFYGQRTTAVGEGANRILLFRPTFDPRTAVVEDLLEELNASASFHAGAVILPEGGLFHFLLRELSA